MVVTEPHTHTQTRIYLTWVTWEDEIDNIWIDGLFFRFLSGWRSLNGRIDRMTNPMYMPTAAGYVHNQLMHQKCKSRLKLF